MVKKGTALLLGFFITQVFYACGSCFGVDTDALPYYNVKGYQFYSHSRITGLGSNNSYTFQELYENEAVEFDKYTMTFGAEVDYHAKAKPLFGNFAFACDPDQDGYRGTLDLLDSVAITSYYDFDDQHSVGANLNEMFGVYTGGTFTTSLQNYLSQENLQAPQGIRLILKEKPTASESQKFKVVFYLASGEVYSTETLLVSVK